MALNKFFPGSTFTGIKDSIVIIVETSKDDTGIDGSETSEGISKAEIVKKVGIRSNSDKNRVKTEQGTWIRRSRENQSCFGQQCSSI